MVYNRDDLLKDLKQHACEIQFTKVNGQPRKMRCTLRSEYLPVTDHQLQHLEEEHKKPENLNSLAVWDLEANGWRSFRIDSVQYAQIIDAY